MSAEILEGKYSLPGLPAFYALEEDTADTLVITLKDSTGSVYVHLHYGVLEEKDIITRSVTVENKGDAPVYLERIMSTCTDFQYGDFDFISFYGRHAMERLYSRTRVHHGIQSVGSTRGASSHHYNPFVMLTAKDTTETSGECYGFSSSTAVTSLPKRKKIRADRPDSSWEYTRIIFAISWNQAIPSTHRRQPWFTAQMAWKPSATGSTVPSAITSAEGNTKSPPPCSHQQLGGHLFRFHRGQAGGNGRAGQRPGRRTVCYG